MTGRSRSLLKALTWRAGGTLGTGVIVGLTAGWEHVAIVVGADTVLKIAAYYVHERVWARWR